MILSDHRESPGNLRGSGGPSPGLGVCYGVSVQGSVPAEQRAKAGGHGRTTRVWKVGEGQCLAHDGRWDQKGDTRPNPMES